MRLFQPFCNDPKSLTYFQHPFWSKIKMKYLKYLYQWHEYLIMKDCYIIRIDINKIIYE